MEYPRSTIGFGTLQMARNPDFSSNYDVLSKMLKQIGERAQQTNTKVILDTAMAYGNVEHIGKFFTENPGLRPYFFIIMKEGINLMDKTQPYVTDPTELRFRLNKCYELLGKVEVLLLHRIDHNSKKIDALYGELFEFKKSGKCDQIGISECNATVLSYLAEKFGVDVFECAWSPFCRRMEKNGVYDVIKKHNIRVITYSSVLRGLFNDGIMNLNLESLTPTDLRTAVFKILVIESNPFENTVGFYDEAHIIQNIRIVQNFMKFAKLNNLSPAELSLACATHMGFVPIPGSSKIDRILENVFSNKTVSSEIFSQVMEITEGFDGDPNPGFLNYLSDPILNM